MRRMRRGVRLRSHARTVLLAAMIAASAGTAFARAAAAQASPAPTAQPQPSDARLAEEDFLRGAGDLALTRVLDDLDRTEPIRDASSAAFAQRLIARQRALLRGDRATLEERLRALELLRTTRAALVARDPMDPYSVLWLADAAEDELALAFLGPDGGADAIAGARGSALAARATAALDRVGSMLDAADARAGSVAPTLAAGAPELLQRIEEDSRVRRPFLRAALQALRLAIERDGGSTAERRDRPAEAARVHDALVALRPSLPQRLRPECDLAEVAAAAVAARCDAARFATARLIQARDATLIVLAKLLSCDCVVNARRSDEALQQLNALFALSGMTTPLRLLVADAIVRTRSTLGKAPTTDPSLRPWIQTLDAAQPRERAGVRRAVLERIAGAVQGQPVYGELPPLARVALARGALIASPSDASALATLAPLAAQTHDPAVQVAALETIAEAVVRAQRWPDAADAYRQLALAAAQEPISLPAMQAALDIEHALDRAEPGSREAQLEQALGLALNRFPELPSRSASAAQLDALQLRRSLADALSQPEGERTALCARTLAAMQRLQELDAAARRAGLDAGSRVAATIEMARTAADFLAAGTAAARQADARPTADQWNAWTAFDAQRVLRLRLERAAAQVPPQLLAQAMRDELEFLPPALVAPQGSTALTAIAAFARRQVELASAARASGSPEAVQLARRALAACEAWDARTAGAGAERASSGVGATLERLHADAAILANEWEDALARAEAISLANPHSEADLRRLVEGLSCAHADAVQRQSRTLRDRCRTEGMDAARRLAERAEPGSEPWWLAQSLQLRIAQESGRGGEGVLAAIARLRAIDPALGGPPHSDDIAATERAAQPVTP